MRCPTRADRRADKGLLAITVWPLLFAQAVLVPACRTSPPPGPTFEATPSHTNPPQPPSHGEPNATASDPRAYASASAGSTVPAGQATKPLVAVRPKAPPTPEGPTPRTVDTPRNAVIEQVRRWVESCFEASGRAGSGRVRVVLRLRKDGTVQQADATVTGTLDPRLGPCSEKNVRAQKVDVQRDTPLFLSFPIVLPHR